MGLFSFYYKSKHVVKNDLKFSKKVAISKEQENSTTEDSKRGGGSVWIYRGIIPIIVAIIGIAPFIYGLLFQESNAKLVKNSLQAWEGSWESDIKDGMVFKIQLQNGVPKVYNVGDAVGSLIVQESIYLNENGRAFIKVKCLVPTKEYQLEAILHSPDQGSIEYEWKNLGLNYVGSGSLIKKG